MVEFTKKYDTKLTFYLIREVTIMSGSQKALKVLSIINIILSIIGLIVALLLIGGTAISSAIFESLGIMGNAVAYCVFTFIGCIIALVCGIVGLKLVKDPSKFMTFAVLVVIDIVITIINTFVGTINATSISSLVVNVIWSLILLYLANNIKKQANA